MEQDFSDSSSMSDSQLLSTIRMEMADIESTLNASVNVAERQVSTARDNVSAAERNAPKTDDMLSRYGSIGGCGFLIVIFCGLLNSCGLMAYSTYENAANLYIVICAIVIIVIIVLARRPAVETSRLRDSKATLTNQEQRLNEARELRATVDEVSTLMESTEPGDMLHDVYRGRLEGLLEDVRSMRGQLQE